MDQHYMELLEKLQGFALQLKEQQTVLVGVNNENGIRGDVKRIREVVETNQVQLQEHSVRLKTVEDRAAYCIDPEDLSLRLAVEEQEKYKQNVKFSSMRRSNKVAWLAAATAVGTLLVELVAL